MSGTLAVAVLYRGQERLLAGYDQAEAQDLAEAVAGMGGWDSPPEVRDLLPGLEVTFPAGTTVWLRVHWRRGQRGTVAAGGPESYARWPERGPSPWFLGAGGVYVYVVLDDGYASWWPAAWLETR